MIQIYHGDGKGKTTAAAGLCVRARGHNIPVIFAQFLKDGSSGEVKMLHRLGVTVMIPDTFFGFVRSMSEEQKERAKVSYAKYLTEIEQVTSELMTDSQQTETISGVLVLDEALHACNAGLLDEGALLAFINKIKDYTEIVLTGRNPSEKFMEIADYCTNFTKEKHPYDQGITARIGVEM